MAGRCASPARAGRTRRFQGSAQTRQRHSRRCRATSRSACACSSRAASRPSGSSFRAPRAITRFDVHYTSTLSGPTGRACKPASGGYSATTGDIAAGETVRIVMRRRGVRSNGRTGWCPGRFTGAVRYSTPAGHTVIGRYAFRIP